MSDTSNELKGYPVASFPTAMKFSRSAVRHLTRYHWERYRPEAVTRAAIDDAARQIGCRFTFDGGGDRQAIVVGWIEEYEAERTAANRG